MIRKDLLNALIARFENSPAWIVAPSFKGQTRNPVLFRRVLFPELLRITGDRGGRGLIERYREKTALVEWEDELAFLDLDIREDYERLNGLAGIEG